MLKRICAGAALLLVGLGALCASAPQAALARAPQADFRLAYVAFLAEPAGGAEIAAYRRDQVPPVLQELQEGGKASLAKGAPAFLKTLTRAEPHLNFRLLFAGETRGNWGEKVSLSGRTPEGHSFPVAVTDELILKPAAHGDHEQHEHTGKIAWGRDHTFGWRGGHRPTMIAGRTYSQGIAHLEEGYLAYAFAFFPTEK